MNEDEFRSGVRADGSRLMQPDTFAASREAAKAIGETPGFDYISEAFVTLSPSWHGELVSKAHFITAINAAIAAANQLDRVKKTLFYGKDNLLAPAKDMPAISKLPLMLGDTEADSATNIIHAIIGIFTEAGEMLEALREAINLGKPLDYVNAKEETGDLFWYVAILARECGFTFEQSQRTNIAKLRARFPDRFTEFDANTRNLGLERAILELPHREDNGPIVGTAGELSDEAKERLSR
jgi:NTP pyrophosphatase (non-canonical NTP hydrolase)